MMKTLSFVVPVLIAIPLGLATNAAHHSLPSAQKNDNANPIEGKRARRGRRRSEKKPPAERRPPVNTNKPGGPPKNQEPDRE